MQHLPIPLDRRLKLIEIADHFGVPIIEDDHTVSCFEGEHIPSIVQLDSQMQQKNGGYTGNVILSEHLFKDPGLWVEVGLGDRSQGSDLKLVM